jgi:hypothetical protein
MTTFVTVGANRVFARVEGEFTYQNWIDALKAGRTFVTNSPVLDFTVNGRDPGATLELNSKAPRPKTVEVRAVAESQIPYDRLEIVANGVVVAQVTPSGARHRAAIHIEHPIWKSCWLAARVSEDMDLYRRRVSTSARSTFLRARASATTMARAGRKRCSRILHPYTSSKTGSPSGVGKTLNITSGTSTTRFAGSRGKPNSRARPISKPPSKPSSRDEPSIERGPAKLSGPESERTQVF